jgi:hypothetical protein
MLPPSPLDSDAPASATASVEWQLTPDAVPVTTSDGSPDALSHVVTPRRRQDAGQPRYRPGMDTTLSDTPAPSVAEWRALSGLELALTVAAREDILPREHLSRLLRRHTARYGQPFVGTTRAVFEVNDYWVLKVPLSDDGYVANEREARWTDHDFIPLAPCQKYFAMPSGILMLWMHSVTPVVLRHDDPDYPEWGGFVDCCQVGWTRGGRLVAYDL